MESHISIVLVLFATIINSIVFGYVASNTNKNEINKSYLIFLTFIILYTIFDCIIIQIFDSIEAKNIIIKIQALFWMPLSILFLNFVYLFLKKQKDTLFYFFITATAISTLVTVFSNRIIFGYQGFNIGTMAKTGNEFLIITFLFILPAAIYSLYLIGRAGNILLKNTPSEINHDPYLIKQLRILFWGSTSCFVIAVSTNIFFDQVFGYSGEIHLASLTLSIQSIFILPALIKYNFLNQPIETMGDELYLNSSDAVFITSEKDIIVNLNGSARKLFNLSGHIKNLNIKELFETDKEIFYLKEAVEAKTKIGHYVTIAQNPITRGNLPLGNILVVRDISARKETEERLLKAEKAHKHFIESTSDVIYNIDLEGNFTFVNNIFEKISGYISDDIIGTNSNNMVREDYKQKVYDTFSSLISREKGQFYNSLQMEAPVITKSGNRLWMELGVNTIVKDNKITGFSVISRNITTRKKAEKKIQHITDKLIQAQDVAGIGNFEYNIENSTVIWSDKLYEIYGLDKGQFVPTNERFFNEVMHPDFRENTLKLVDGALKTKEKSLDYFHKILISNGIEKWMHTIAKIDYTKKGKPIHISGTSQDVTELYSTRILLEESENRLQKAQELAQLGNWEENHKTGEIYWSPVLRKMFEIDLDNPIGPKTFWSLMHPDDTEEMENNWKKAEKEQKVYSGTFRIKLKKGKIKHIMEHAEFIPDLRGKLYKTIGTVIDITELRQYQEELRNLSSHIQNVQEKERGRIANEIHDVLGQRLTCITMDLSFLRSKIGKNTTEEIKERLKALNVLAEETINLTRKISQELRPSILDDLGLISAIDWLKEQYNQRTDIDFTMDMPKNEVEINDEAATAVFRITQEALTNIMRHADAKNVNIQIKLENSEILLIIQDDGKGIVEKKKNNNEQTFGVFGMKERANSLGGKLIIGSNANNGTSVNLILPYKQKQEITT